MEENNSVNKPKTKLEILYQAMANIMRRELKSGERKYVDLTHEDLELLDNYPEEPQP